jgi:YD repeat-containing protein
LLFEPGATTLAPYVLGLPASEQITVSTDTFRRTWSYTNPTFLGFLTQSTGFARPGATGIVTTFSPDSRGNVATVATATSSTSYLYSWGVVSQISTAGHTTSRVINQDGTTASETKGGRTTSFQYDDLGRPTVVTPPGGSNPAETSYDPNGASTTTTRGTAPTTSSVTTFLDSFGRPTGTLNSQGVRTTIQYDAEGRVKYRSLPFYGSADIGTMITYDALDRVKRETNSDNTDRQYTYGADTTTIVDEEGRQTVHRFVAFGHPDDARLTIVTDAKQQPWAYAYDVLGRIRNVTAPDGIARTWEYNDQSLLFRETHPESGITTYQYNAGGLLAQKTDAKGQTFVYTYDGNDRLRTIAVGSELTTFTYEAGSDNRKSMDVDSVHTEFAYDAAGRRASRVDMVDGFKFTTAFAYDNNDNLTSISYPSFGSSGNRRQIGYEYDSERRLTRVRDLLVSRDFATNFSYHASGALLGYTAGNGVPSTFTYHLTRYWMTSLSVGSHWSLQYSNYDNVGNVQSIIDSRAGMNQDLFYDELDRLVSVSAGQGYPSAVWAYDIHGNRTDANGTTYTYYPGKLRLWTQNTDTYTYDNNGNLLTTTTPGRSFTYTAWNGVASVTIGSTTTNYRYDADDWRVKKSSGTTTTYFLRGLNGELLTEWKNPGTSGETRDYIYAGSRLITAIKRPWNETSDWYGTIIPGGPPVTVMLTIPDQRAWLTFEGTAGQRVSLWGFNGMTGQILGCDVNVSILKPPDNSVFAPATCMEGSGFIDTLMLPVTGTYTVLIDPVANSVGSLTLRLYDVPPDLSGALVAGGAPVALTFTTPGQNGSLTFTGTVGQRVTLLGFNAMGGQVSLTCDVTVRIVKPDLTNLVPDTCMESGGFIDVLTLPTTGTYTIPMNPAKWATGNLSLQLYDVPVDLNLTIVPGGAPVSMNFAVPGQNATLTFTGTVNQRISLRWHQWHEWPDRLGVRRHGDDSQARHERTRCRDMHGREWIH